MTTLHIIRSSASSTGNITHCLSALDRLDTVVIMDDGVYNFTHEIFTQLSAIIPKNNLLVIKEHAVARAIQIPEQCTGITISGLVEYMATCTQSITWQ